MHNFTGTITHSHNVGPSASWKSEGHNVIMIAFTTEGDDYTPLFATVVFSPGVTMAEVLVETVEDDSDETDETFTAVLSEPSEGAVIGSTMTATVNIRDDDGEDHYTVATQTSTGQMNACMQGLHVSMGNREQRLHHNICT